MLPHNRASASYNYVVIHYVSDSERDQTIPVGVALSSADLGTLRFRFPEAEEKVASVPLASALPSLRLLQSKADLWARTGELPYAEGHIKPLSREWWDHVRKMMQFRFRIAEPKPIDCSNPDQDLETLFEAAVHPHIPMRLQQMRVNGAVTKALGKIADVMPYAKPVDGYGGRPVTVLRQYSSPRGTLVVEAVNFAAANAEREADALTSKLQRIQNANPNVAFVLGYLASPAGLNGEGVLKNWVENKIGVRMYDLVSESGNFREDAEHRIDDYGGLGILHDRLSSQPLRALPSS